MKHPAANCHLVRKHLQWLSAHLGWTQPGHCLDAAWTLPGRCLDAAWTCYSNAAWTLIFNLKAEVNGEGPIVHLATELAL